MKIFLYTTLWFNYSIANEKKRTIQVGDKVFEKCFVMLYSLREILHYNDEIFMLYFGGPMPELLNSLFHYYNVKIIPALTNSISGYYPGTDYYRYSAILDLYEKNKLDDYDYVIYTDCDMQFLEDFSSITEEYPSGCVYGGFCDIDIATRTINSKNVRIINELQKKFNDFSDLKMKSLEIKDVDGKDAKLFKGLNSGFMAGNKTDFIRKIELYKKAIDFGLCTLDWGCSQFLVPYFYDFNEDHFDYRYNFDLLNRNLSLTYEENNTLKLLNGKNIRIVHLPGDHKETYKFSKKLNIQSPEIQELFKKINDYSLKDDVFFFNTKFPS